MPAMQSTTHFKASVCNFMQCVRAVVAQDQDPYDALMNKQHRVSSHA